MRLFKRRRQEARSAGQGPGPQTPSLDQILAEFLTVPPDAQNAFDLFSGAWSSAFDGVQTSGSFRGTDDARLKWLFERVDVAGNSVLELGPLEGGHTVMLERAGAKVLAVESNKGAFLRCLVTKNHFDLAAKFLLGDFEKMALPEAGFDLVLASGVLYHMKDPVQLLQSLSRAADTLFIWTHYFEPDLSLWHPALQAPLADGKWDHRTPTVVQAEGMDIRLVRQRYGEALGWSGFCGGSDVYSNWIYREDLLGLMKQLGFGRVEIAFDDLAHPNGPAFCLLCRR